MAKDFLDQLGITGSPRRKKRRRSVSASQPVFVPSHLRTRRKKTKRVRSYVRRQKRELDFLDQLGITGTSKSKRKKRGKPRISKKTKRKIERAGEKALTFGVTKAAQFAKKKWKRMEEERLVKERKKVTKIPAQRFRDGTGVTLGARPVHRPATGMEWEERMKARKAERQREPARLVPVTSTPARESKKRGLVSRIFLKEKKSRNGGEYKNA